jgi:hypothetical protein
LPVFPIRNPLSGSGLFALNVSKRTEKKDARCFNRVYLPGLLRDSGQLLKGGIGLLEAVHGILSIVTVGREEDSSLY